MLCGPPNRNTKSSLLRPFDENLAGCVRTVSVKNPELSLANFMDWDGIHYD